jgi:hypothetical protein
VNATDNSINMVQGSLQLDQLANFIEQLRPLITALPQDQRTAIEPHLTALQAEMANPIPTQTKIRSTLESIRVVAEGAAGNIIAAGIISIISNLLGA